MVPQPAFHRGQLVEGTRDLDLESGFLGLNISSATYLSHLLGLFPPLYSRRNNALISLWVVLRIKCMQSLLDMPWHVVISYKIAQTEVFE